MATESLVVVGVFTNRTYAEQALQELREAGFPDDHIGFILRDGDTTTQSLAEPDNIHIPLAQGEATTGNTETEAATTTGAVTGGVVGGLMGAAAALLIPGLGPAIAGGILTATIGGAALGAAAGGIIGSLVNLGISQEEAEYYNREFQAGRTIVIVQADDRPLDAFHILRHNQAYNATTPPEVQDPEATVKLEEPGNV